MPGATRAVQPAGRGLSDHQWSVTLHCHRHGPVSRPGVESVSKCSVFNRKERPVWGGSGQNWAALVGKGFLREVSLSSAFAEVKPRKRS